MNAVYALEKHGELMLNDEGTAYGNAMGRNMLDRRRVNKLAALGICRIDEVGASTFAVFVKIP